MDNSLRNAERSGDPVALLRERCRAGVPVRLLRERCDKHKVRGDCCGKYTTTPAKPCHSPTWAAPAFEAALNLAAYVGMAEARGAIGLDALYALSPKIPTDPSDLGLGLWLTGLTRCAKALPPLTVEGVACGDRHTNTIMRDARVIHRCPTCKGTGTRSIEIPASRYVLTLCAWAAAREVLPKCAGCGGKPTRGGLCADHYAASLALDACEAWLCCPCPEREAALKQVLHGELGFVGHGRPEWLSTDPKRAIQAADALTGTARQACVEAVRLTLDTTEGDWL